MIKIRKLVTFVMLVAGLVVITKEELSKDKFQKREFHKIASGGNGGPGGDGTSFDGKPGHGGPGGNGGPSGILQQGNTKFGENDGSDEKEFTAEDYHDESDLNNFQGFLDRHPSPPPRPKFPHRPWQMKRSNKAPSRKPFDYKSRHGENGYGAPGGDGGDGKKTTY